jgi:hypothetical protein
MPPYMVCFEIFVRNDSILRLEKVERIAGRKACTEMIAGSKEPWLEGPSFLAEPCSDLGEF